MNQAHEFMVRSEPTVWGLNVRALHDRFWASHGVHVVRLASSLDERDLAAGGIYLLLEPDELVLLNLPADVHRRKGLQRVEIVEPTAPPYSERVIVGADGRLDRVLRQYAPSTRSERVVLVTRKADFARRWSHASETASAMRELRLATGLRGTRCVSAPGRVYDGADAADASRCTLEIMARWQDVSSGCPQVRSAGSGVWVHETASIDPRARLVGPVWVGGGVSVEAGETVVGPCILVDEQRPSTTHATPPAARVRSPLGTPPSPRRRMGKRIFDIALSSIALILSAPLLPLVALAIWLEDGRPIFFAHTRQTLGGRDFVCYKFRTMCKDAERLKASLATANVCDGPQFHIEHDPRLLRVGRVLRHFHLDELPQFLNILLGQMSVIGPRPSPDGENQFCPAWREARLSVKPGLTGLWQVNRTRAPNIDFQEWIRHDLDYVHHQTWGRDLFIIYKTTTNILGRLKA